ncbi:MAG: SpoIIE family protein phosphatase [Lachnospiraceae bacterium]|nr:SpoIIE family protein phosphatase [Lachnospiraceae bacterium]
MSVCVDYAYKSLNKYQEELCGDKVEFLRTDDFSIFILADGMGSGVKANILATLTVKILGTMFKNGAGLEECVETIIRTLPVCQVRHVAYSTFTILQIFDDGNAYLVEFDNPSCIFIRDGLLVPIPANERTIADKTINEYRFRVKEGDVFVLTSDGVTHAGMGQTMNFGWGWENAAHYAEGIADGSMSAARMADRFCQACEDLYIGRMGDDTTAAVIRIIGKRAVAIFSGPPQHKEDDEAAVEKFMSLQGRKVICGGTSARITSRILKRPLRTSLDYIDPDVPPLAWMEGMDLVTEGILTLRKVVEMLESCVDHRTSGNFFQRLDEKDGGSRLAKLLLEDCTHLELIVGTAINAAYQVQNLPIDFAARMELIGRLKTAVERLGKQVEVTYY